MENNQKRRKLNSTQAIKAAIPERFQIRPDIEVNRKLTKVEIGSATAVISKSIADYRGILMSPQLSKAVENILTLLSQEFMEIPYIWTYKCDLVDKLSRADLWQIFDLEYEFRKIVEMRDQMSKTYLPDSYINKILLEVKETEEIYDLNVYIKSQERNTSPIEYSHELRRRGMLPKGKYLEYILKGLLKVVDKFGVQIPSFVQTLNSKTTCYQPKNEDSTPLEVVKQYYPQTKVPDELLQQSMELFAHEISVDPLFRKFIRSNYIQHGFLITSPLEAISVNDKCWPYCFWRIQIKKTFNIGGDIAQILHYKNQNMINTSFQLQNEERLLETLKNNIVSNDAKPAHVQWNECRTDAVIKAYNILKPNIESWLMKKLETNAERWIMEQCMLNLERRINVKPFRTPEMHKNAIPRVFALSYGNGEFEDVTRCVYMNKDGKKEQEWVWTTIRIPDSKERKEFLGALNKFKPHIIVVRCYNFKTKFLLNYVKNSVDHHNENQIEKAIVVVTDDKVAMEMAKKEFLKSSELSEYCTSLAKMVQNPLMEHLRLGDNIVAIEFHPLQYLLSKEKLKEALDRAFINIINEVGADINDILNNEFNEPKQRILHYICGLGSQTSIRLKKLIFGKEYNPMVKPFIDSRLKLKDYLEPKVFQNSIGFLRICNSIEPMDNSRIHPEFYNLAHRSAPDMDDTCPHLMQLISRESNNPFGDRRQDYKIPTSDQVFEMITKETIYDSIYSGLIVSVVVKKFITNCLIVHLNASGFECRIGWDYIEDKNLNEGDTLNALVKFINKETFTIVLSCMQTDLEGGRKKSFYEKRFNEFIDQETKYNYQHPAKVEEPKTQTRIINHPCFERVSAQGAERKLFTHPIGSYVIRPTTINPEKLSITWKLYDNVYRHLHIDEVEHKLFVEGEKEVYETLDELLEAHVQKINEFIDKLTNHQKFRSEEQLDEFLETYTQQNPQYGAYGFCIDKAHPGSFVCGYKFHPGEQVLKLRGFFRPYGFRVENSRFYNLNDFVKGIKKKIRKEHAEF